MMTRAREAPRRFYSTRDISEMLSIGMTKAREYMYRFESCGKCFREGKLVRVDADEFDRYIKSMTRRRA